MSGASGIAIPQQADAWLVRWMQSVEQRVRSLEAVPSAPGSIAWPWLRPTVVSGTPTDALLEGEGPYRVPPGLPIWDDAGKRQWIRDTSGAWYKSDVLTP